MSFLSKALPKQKFAVHPPLPRGTCPNRLKEQQSNAKRRENIERPAFVDAPPKTHPWDPILAVTYDFRAALSSRSRVRGTLPATLQLPDVGATVSCCFRTGNCGYSLSAECSLRLGTPRILGRTLAGFSGGGYSTDTRRVGRGPSRPDSLRESLEALHGYTLFSGDGQHVT